LAAVIDDAGSAAGGEGTSGKSALESAQPVPEVLPPQPPPALAAAAAVLWRADKIDLTSDPPLATFTAICPSLVLTEISAPCFTRLWTTAV